MNAWQGGEKSGLPPAHQDHLSAPWGSYHEGRDFMLSLICCLDTFRGGQLEDTYCGNSAESSPTTGIGPTDAVGAPNLGEIHSQKGMTVLLREEVSRLQEEVHLLRQMKEMLTKDLEESQGGKSPEVLSATELRVQLGQKEQELARAREALQGE
ncbi:hypothetical protein MC885_015838 [Smutsia gigantea]|nr:hypothetical protein MC885_015838 [Smutsia gigantea]